MHNHHMMSFSELVSNFPNDLNEILLIKMIGLSNKGFSGFLNSPVWTVSAMIIVEFLIICLLSYKKELYYNVICPFSIIIGTGICNNAENLRVGAWLGFCSAGLLRVYVLTCISYYCYILAKLIYKQKFTLHKEILLSLVEFICIVFLLIIMMLSRADWKTYIIPAILFTSIASAIAISGKGISSKIIKSNKLTNYLGKLSFAIFLIHIPIVNLFNAYLKDYNAIYSHKFLFVAMVLLASMIFNFVMDCILRSTGLTKINNT